MANGSFVQSLFLGGVWSATAQGRTHDQNYKSAMNVCRNGYPLEAGCWSRRQGFRYLGHTRGGVKAQLRAFDFTITAPYQLEFTPGYLRLWAGLGLLQEADGTLNVSTISADTPAKVFLVQAIPAAWNVGDTIMFNILSVPCSTTQVCGRQFTIAAINRTANYITINDALTGAAVNGATIAFVYSAGVDQIFKVFELVTPYQAADIGTLRTVQEVTSSGITTIPQSSVLILSTKYQPRAVTTAANPQPFQINAQAFQDGPYLDINTTTTTLTPSGTTGSITMTASSTTGINGGSGFVATDVGRFIRFQASYPAWNSGTTYNNLAVVLGSDNNQYRSIQNGNLNHDPTTNVGSGWWVPSIQSPHWGWMIITAVNSTTQVTCTVQDSAAGVTDPNVLHQSLASTNATTVWQLGLYSNTTGWPGNGTWKEGRLWLSGLVPNRFDASYSNSPFNFGPTQVDGTVSDANAISDTLNAEDNNTIFWMKDIDQGCLMGTQAAEWLLFSESTEQPMTPTNINAKRVSTYGCANVEPVNASVVCLVQREQRRLLAHAPLINGKFFADNLNELADSLSVSGLQEIRWQQSPNLTIWARRGDGTLAGTTFQKMPMYSAYQARNGSFTAWHDHAHGQGRVFESISGGPSFDGLSDALYAVTNNAAAGKSDTNIRHVECLMPLFDDSQADWSAFFVDGGATPCCSVQRAIANGDSFDGIQTYGLTPLIGQTVQPVLGGLDLGDKVVAADGSVSIPYLSDPETAFTLAFWQALSNGTNYGLFSATVSYTTQVANPAPPQSANTLDALALTSADPGYAGTVCALDGPNDKFYVVTGGNSTNTPPGSVRRFTVTAGTQDYNTTVGNCVNTLYPVWSNGVTYNLYDIVMGSDNNPYVSNTGGNLGNDPTTHPVQWSAIGLSNNPSILGSDGNLYCSLGAAENSTPILKIAGGTGIASAKFGVISASLSAGSSTGLTTSFGMAHTNNVLCSVGIRSASATNELCLLNTSTMAFFANLGQTTEAAASVCAGPDNMFFAIAHDFALPSTGSIGIYSFPSNATALYKAGTIAPATVDATWSHFSAVSGPACDQRDGGIMLFVSTNDAVTTTKYIIKVNPFTAVIVWKLAMTGINPPDSNMFALAKIPTQRFVWMDGANFRKLNTSAGTLTTTAFNSGIGATGGQQYDDTSESVTYYGNWSYNTNPPAVTEIGAYLTAHPTSGFTTLWARNYAGNLGGTSPNTITYTIPLSLGFTYTSQGQLLRPDFGEDTAARAGPGFGKRRRVHWWASLFRRARRVSLGTDFAGTLKEYHFASKGGTPIVAPGLYSGVATDTLIDDHGFDSMIAWQISRPYPCIVAEMGGYIASSDK